MAARLPEDLADVVINAADEQGVSISDYIAGVLAEAHGHPRTAVKPPPRTQEVLPISA